MKDHIIDKAYGLFLNHSYKAVSISDISKAIGVTKGALYHHFLNKEELFMAVIDKYLAINTVAITEETSLKEYIEESIKQAQKIVLNVFSSDQPYVPFNYISMFIDAFRNYPGFAEDKKNLFGGEIDKIKIVMTNAVKRGEIRPDIDISIMALNLFAVTLGIVSNLFSESSVESALSIFRSQMNEIYKLLKI